LYVRIRKNTVDSMQEYSPPYFVLLLKIDRCMWFNPNALECSGMFVNWNQWAQEVRGTTTGERETKMLLEKKKQFSYIFW